MVNVRTSEETRVLFDQWASSYDSDVENANGILEGYGTSISIAANLCRAHEAETILDIGIGTGKFTEKLEKEGVEIYGVDLSQKMLNECIKLHPDYKLNVGTFQELPHKDDIFNGIVSSFCFDEVPVAERRKACEEMYRTLKPGGYIGILDIMFASPSAMLEAKQQIRKYWDDSEDYALVGDFSELLYRSGFHSVQWVQTTRLHWLLLAYK